ncbi:MAG: ThiF family adenylyltransferase [Synergistetes bacterium]|nr:ThiF family adenylyltransferase [Synergistota bacterium]MDW8191730.1 ThiF family adenylyltransferase [Synergistota bacterium]
MNIWLRHEKLVEMGILRSASLLVAGAGGLGSTVLELLVRLGIGKIYIVDNGIVDKPDLNRQILYDSKDLGKKKVQAAIEKLSEISKETVLDGIFKDINSDDFTLPEDIMGIVDCLDNWKSRFKLENLARERELFLVHGGVKEMYGQITTLMYPETPSLREIFGEVKEERNLQVYPPLVIALASLQVWETVNALLGRPRLLGKLLVLDLWEPSLEIVEICKR